MKSYSAIHFFHSLLKRTVKVKTGCDTTISVNIFNKLIFYLAEISENVCHCLHMYILVQNQLFHCWMCLVTVCLQHF